MFARGPAQSVPAAFDDFVASGPDAIDRAAARGKDPAVDGGVSRAPRQRRMRDVERDDVGARTWRETDWRLRQCPRTA
ncbi:hypothetical protein ACVWXM_006410 [Bradyrhizobium sp. GM7.3]